jgi:ribosomal protein S18 acetylase RimI-like enzyme
VRPNVSIESLDFARRFGWKSASARGAVRMIAIRPLCEDEFDKLGELDVTEEGDVVYAWRDGRLIQVPKLWRRPPMSREKREKLVAAWRAGQRAGWVVLGALDGDQSAGIAALVPRLTDTMAQLHYLHVSRQYRRRGVARRLVAEVVHLAREGGARELYVSATPSVSAVGFYQSFGFVPVAEPHPEIFALEPEDIHMSLALDQANASTSAPET